MRTTPVILAAIALIVGGVVFLIWPNIFRRWFWKKTDIAQRVLSPEKYTLYMRGMGVLYIVAGILAIVFAESVAEWLRSR